MKRKLTTVQIITLILVFLYIVWEKNMQQYLADPSLEYAVQTRYDLMVIIPILVVLIVISIWQWRRE